MVRERSGSKSDISWRSKVADGDKKDDVSVLIISKGISLPSNSDNDNTSNNNDNWNDEDNTYPDLSSYRKRPIPFWVAHLYSVELLEDAVVRMTSSTVKKLLRERYGLNVPGDTIRHALSRMVDKGLLTKSRPPIRYFGRGGVRKAYYYIAKAEDRSRLLEFMSSYDGQERKRSNPSMDVKILQRLDRIERMLNRLMEVVQK